MSAGGPFRRAAVERLSTPERLDEVPQLLHPRRWLFAVGVIASALALLAWRWR